MATEIKRNETKLSEKKSDGDLSRARDNKKLKKVLSVTKHGFVF